MARLFGSLVVLVLLVGGGSASAETIWGNTATSGPIQIASWDTTTGAKLQEFTLDPSGNGRGVVIVGDVIYWTKVNDPHIYKVDAITGLPLGSILTQNDSMSTIAWDGKYFWTSDYSGSNEAYQIDPATGLNVRTINMSLAGSNMDGMEFYYNGLGEARLIANRGDAVGPYDIYDLDGNVIDDAFITTTFQPTGIAYDGTNFYVSNIFSQEIALFSGVDGSFMSAFTYDAFSGSFQLIEDLSFDYTITLPPPDPTEVPEPATLTLFATGFAMAARRLRKRHQ